VSMSLGWAVLGMELAVALALLWNAVQLRFAPGPLGPILVASALLVGFGASLKLPALAISPQRRLISGLALGVVVWFVGARASLPLLDQLFSTRSAVEPSLGTGAETAQSFLVSGLVAAVLVAALWWRGSHLASAADQLGTGDVRGEFATGAIVLLIMLIGMRAFLPIPALPGAAIAFLFVISGLSAVGMARQGMETGESGVSPAALVVAATVLFVLVGVVLLLLLSPGVVDGLAELLLKGVGLIGTLIRVVLQGLESLLDLVIGERESAGTVELSRPAQEAGNEMEQPSAMPAGPVWLETILSWGAMLLFVVLGLCLVWLLFMVLGSVWSRPRGTAVMPTSIERLDEDWRETVRSGVGNWLGQLSSRVPTFTRDPVVDARSAYRGLLRWARSQGIERRSGETPLSLRQRLERAYPRGTAAYTTLTNAYEAERYGNRPADASRIAELARQLDQLRGG
jgi:hypothetical protein